MVMRDHLSTWHSINNPLQELHRLHEVQSLLFHRTKACKLWLRIGMKAKASGQAFHLKEAVCNFWLHGISLLHYVPEHQPKLHPTSLWPSVSASIKQYYINTWTETLCALKVPFTSRCMHWVHINVRRHAGSSLTMCHFDLKYFFFNFTLFVKES